MVIKSKIMGRTFVFHHASNGYVYVDLNGLAGVLGNQICEAGRLQGATIRCYSASDLKRVCLNWYRSYVRKNAGAGQ
jgi:hypothetical protein